jgi:hypothetical protein
VLFATRWIEVEIIMLSYPEQTVHGSLIYLKVDLIELRLVWWLPKTGESSGEKWLGESDQCILSYS